MDDIYYFQRKLFQALKYPLSRVEQRHEKQSINDVLTSETGTIARDELKWGRFLKKHQDKFADAFLDLFLLHLDFIGYKTEYELTKSKLNISMTVPNNFLNKLYQAELSEKWENYSNTAQEEISKIFRMKHFLGWTEEEIQENIADLKRDKEEGLTPSDTY